MRKIRLDVDELEVESFAADVEPETRGTVRAAMSGDIPCETQYGNYTCDGYYSCDRWVECYATFVEPMPARGRLLIRSAHAPRHGTWLWNR